MKISVLGDIIDTEDIYQISQIEDHSGMTKVYAHISLVFKIHFFNHRELIVHHYVQLKELTQYEDCHKDNMRKFTTLRDAVIAYWSNNQSEIPKLELI